MTTQTGINPLKINQDIINFAQLLLNEVFYKHCELFSFQIITFFEAIKKERKEKKKKGEIHHFKLIVKEKKNEL